MADQISSLFTFNDFLPLVGEYGCYQKLLNVFTFIYILPHGMQFFITYFIAADSNWQCVLNSTVCNFNGTFSKKNKARCLIPRNEWKFTKSTEYSIITKYDIYCENEWKVHLLTSLFFAGLLSGSIVLGWMSDKYGRRRIVGATFCFMIITGCISSFMPNIEFLMLCRFIIGFMAAGADQMFILINEMVGNQKRALAGSLVWQGFAIGAFLLAIKAYLISDWRYLLLACTAPYILLIAFYPVLPESVRWLYLHEKTNQAMEVLKKMAKWNKKDIPGNIRISYSTINANEKSTLKGVFRDRKYIIITLILGFGWFVSTICFYGVTLAAVDLGGSMYLNFVLIALIEIPGTCSMTYLSNIFGRKKTAVYSLFVGSLACISVAFIPVHMPIIKVTVGLFGKFFITICYATMWTWTAEIYPTIIRAGGMGIASFCGRLGGVMISWVVKYLLQFHHILPFLVMGCASFIGAFMLLYIPETMNKDLEEGT